MPAGEEEEEDSSAVSLAAEGRQTGRRLQTWTRRTRGSMGRKAVTNPAAAAGVPAAVTEEVVVDEGRRASVEVVVVLAEVRLQRRTVRLLAHREAVAAVIDARASRGSPRRRKPSHNLLTPNCMGFSMYSHFASCSQCNCHLPLTDVLTSSSTGDLMAI